MFRDFTFSLMVGAAAFLGTFAAQALYDYQRKQALISSIERFRDDIRSMLPADTLRDKPPLVFQKTALDKLLDSVADGLEAAVDGMDTTSFTKTEFDPRTYQKIQEPEWRRFAKCYDEAIMTHTNRMAVTNCARHMPYQP